MLDARMKIIYIHVPKTAGISICTAFNSSDISHKKLNEYARACNLADYYKFSIVRNPWDRLVSCYFYFKNGQRIADACAEGRQPVIKYKELIDQFDTFKDFLYFFNNNFDKFENRIEFMNQRYFLAGDFDYIGRYENLETSLIHVCKQIGIPMISLPISNTSTHLPYYTYYENIDMINIVKNIYKDDIKTFKYKYIG